MGKRSHLLLLVVTSLLAGALGSLVAVAASTDVAQACSIAGPHAEVWPSSELRPGQTIEIAGWGFVDVRFSEQRPEPEPPVEAAIAIPPELCDFDSYPIGGIDVVWHGNSSERLVRVSGPEFKLAVTVPLNAVAGPASISIGSVRLAVHVGPDIEPPPPPCALTARPDETATHLCPEPWPCPQFETAASSSTQPFSGGDDAPGFLRPCPEPCVDYAHTIDEGTAYDARWDCPDPCGYSEANPGAPSADAAVWCPPPPDPCVYNADAVRPTDAAVLVGCPDPCGMAGDAAAVWCPPPPDRCLHYADGVRPTDAEDLIWCPDPPAESVDANTLSPDLTNQSSGATEGALSADSSTAEALFSANPAVPVTASNAVLSITQWIMRIAQGLMAALLG